MYSTKIFGPPGTGKTRRLMDLFELELKTTDPKRIAFLTFTRAARLEALGRTGMTEEDLPYLRTIHAICYRELGTTQNQVVKPRDLKDFAKATGVNLSGATADPWRDEGIIINTVPTRDDLLLQINHLGRHQQVKMMKSLENAPFDIDYHYAKWFTQSYRKWKNHEGLIDYTDLLSEYLAYGKPLPIDVIFIDEAQDLSSLQWEVVRKLGANAKRKYIAGDDDQAIFVWAGASADSFIREYADDVEFLEHSFRLNRGILRVALDIIQRVRGRVDKPISAREEEGFVGALAYLTEEDLGDGTSFVLFRNHHRGRLLREQLEELGWPFLGEQSYLGQVGVQRALSGWKELINGNRINSFQARSIVDVSNDDFVHNEVKQIGRKDHQIFGYSDIFNREFRFDQWQSVLTKLPGREYLDKVYERHGFELMLKPKTELMSIHQSKGREADTVVVDVEMARKTYDAWFRNDEDEHRVWYVAVTRAKHRLYTVVPEGTMYYSI